MKVGDAATLSCTAFGAAGQTSISWTKDGSAYTDNLITTPEADFLYKPTTNSISSRIIITSVSNDDDGIYKCIHSTDDTAEDTITLDVFGELKLF